MQGGERYNSIGDHLKSVFGCKTVKLSIDAGFTCPNRDGTAGYGGCAFCSEGGSGELASHASSSVSDYSASISEQIDRLSEKWPDACYLAYFQSFTNTYAPVEVLRSRYYAALDDPRISGIAIATRPDCLGDDVLDLLEEINRDHFMWVELGLQTIHEDTARRIRRGYALPVFDQAVRDLRSAGIEVIVHTILGLPGETRSRMLETVEYLGHCDIQGIKLQLLHILSGTDLAQEYCREPFPVFSREEYLDLVIRCLEILPPQIVIHRLTGDGPKDLLIAPLWSRDKRRVLNELRHRMAMQDTWQGRCFTP